MSIRLNQRHNFRNKITYLSFIMAILIVYRHGVNIKIYDVTGILYWFQLFVQHLTDTIVPCFFALSGYLFYQNFNYLKLKEKLQSRVKTLILPFIIWCLIGYLFFITLHYIAGNVINRELPQFELKQTLLDIFIYTKYNVTWFLFNLIVYTYTFPLLYILFKDKMIGFILTITIIALGYYLDNKFVLYSAPYALGVFCGIHYKQLVQEKYSNSAICIAAFIFIASIVIETYLNIGQGPTHILLRMIQIILIWIFADVIAINITPKWWMTISFFIYCIHSMILESYEKIMLLLFGNTSLGSLLDFVLAPIMTFITIYFIAVILRNNDFIWGCLTGYRNNNK